MKIPATEPGLGAIEEMIASGRNINVTLIFSLDRHKQVMEAYIRGLERLVESGGDPANVHSVASFFVSRVDTEVDKRLEALGRTDLAGTAAVANARLAYQRFEEMAQLVVVTQGGAEKLPSWFLVEVVRDLPRLVEH